MKTAKRLLLLAAFMPLVAFGQQNFPLVKDGGIWREGYVVKVEPPDPWLKFTMQWVMEGDTVFNNQTYKKLYNTNYGPSILLKTFFGGMREDSIGRVYIYTATNQSPPGIILQSQTEYLLYDFSLQVGDTLQVINDWNIIQTLTSIDSVMIDNQYRKRYIYNAWGQREVIEGIGSVKGLFFPMVHEFEHGQLLTCYEDADIFWNNPELFGADCFTVGIEERRQGNSVISIYPLPVSEKLHVVFEEVPTGDISIRLYDITGRLVEDFHYTGQKEIIINAENIKTGTYFMHVNTDCMGSRTIKVIKN